MACHLGKHHEKRVSVTPVGYGYYDVRHKCDACGKSWTNTEGGPF